MVAEAMKKGLPWPLKVFFVRHSSVASKAGRLLSGCVA